MRKGETFERVRISRKEYNQLKKIEKTITSTKIYQRVQAIKLIHKDWKYSAIAEFLNITKDTMTDWVNIYKKTGLSGLLKLKYRGKIPLLSEEQLAELRAKKSTFKVAKEARKYIKDNYGVNYNSTYIHELLKKNFIYPLKEQN
jgi:transposase